MNASGTALVVHVLSVRGLHIKGSKAVDAYCSLSTMGKGAWKSKVSTNALRIDPTTTVPESQLIWDEHCEFQLNDSDTRLVIHVNHKTGFGTTETIGELIFQLDRMPRVQPLAWFRLTKAGSAQVNGETATIKDRGQIQLGFQFSNPLGNRGSTSVSNMSLNKIEKENKLKKLRRKMQQLGRKTTDLDQPNADDSQSLTSVSIAFGQPRLEQQQHLQSSSSRRASFSSTNSGAHIIFSSPSPNPSAQLLTDELTSIGGLPRAEDALSTQSTNFVSDPKARSGNVSGQQQLSSLNVQAESGAIYDSHAMNTKNDGREVNRVPVEASFNRPIILTPNASNNRGGARLSISGGSVASGNFAQALLNKEDSFDSASCNDGNLVSSQKLRFKMRRKAEQLFHLRGLSVGGDSASRKQQKTKSDQALLDVLELADQQQGSRCGSIASSSGFASLGSGQLGALNEHTSPEYLLNVIKHLRKELLNKEERIRCLEEYTDKLLSKVMVTNPELLAAGVLSPKPGGHRKNVR